MSTSRDRYICEQQVSEFEIFSVNNSIGTVVLIVFEHLFSTCIKSDALFLACKLSPKTNVNLLENTNGAALI